MEQLRKRFDSGLDIKELFIDDYRTTEEEQPEVSCSYNIIIVITMLPCNQMRLQHDAKEKALVGVYMCGTVIISYTRYKNLLVLDQLMRNCHVRIVSD